MKLMSRVQLALQTPHRRISHIYSYERLWRWAGEVSLLDYNMGYRASSWTGSDQVSSRRVPSISSALDLTFGRGFLRSVGSI